MPLASAARAAPGVGSRTGLTSCSRSTRSHTMNNASGPISGSRRAARNLRGGRFAAGVAAVNAVAVMAQPL